MSRKLDIIPYLVTEIEWPPLPIHRIGPHLHLRCLSTGDEHPLSQTDGLIKLPENCIPLGNPFQGCRVCGDCLALVVFKRRKFFLLVWNWCTGTLIVDMVRIFVS